MSKLILLVGPPGSGKSTLSLSYSANEGYVYINQDLQQKDHLRIFNDALQEGKDIVLDRLNFSKGQRNRYLDPAKAKGYETKIIVLHGSYYTCFHRCIERKDHLTIKNETDARSALNMFFSKYERVSDDEADSVERVWPKGHFPDAVWIDVDNTLSDATHREHHVQGEKKNWKAFFADMGKDTVNHWCRMLAIGMQSCSRVLICSARPDSYRKVTEEWLALNDIPYDELIMRHEGDFRKDSVVKEIIYEFEVKTRYNLLFSVDDRKQVIDQIRTHGVTVLDCAGEKGHF